MIFTNTRKMCYSSYMVMNHVFSFGEGSDMRTVLHCDCNAFFASVESIDNPELKNVPMAVGGSSELRHGIILAKNEIAKRYGIKTAETVWSAKKKCPQLVIVPPRHERYEEISRKINGIYQEYTEFVEPFGIDESWLDVTDVKELFGDGVKIANELRQRMKNEIGLTISVGVSFTKSFAKLGSDYKKPDATTVIMPENMEEIVYPQKLGNLLYAGKKICEELGRYGIETIGDMAKCDKDFLKKNFGKNAMALYNYAVGQDKERVRSIYEKEEIKSVGNSYTFPKSLTGEEEIKGAVIWLADVVSSRLRCHGLKCTAVGIVIKDENLKTITRQMTTIGQTSSAKDIFQYSMKMIKDNWSMKCPIRMLGITAYSLVKEGLTQVSLFDIADNGRKDRLDKTIDVLRGKFGQGVLKFAGETDFKTEYTKKSENE